MGNKFLLISFKFSKTFTSAAFFFFFFRNQDIIVKNIVKVVKRLNVVL